MAEQRHRGGNAEPGETLVEWFTLHGKKLAIGAIVLAAAAGGVWAYRESTEATRRSAEQALYAAQGAFVSGNVQLAQTDLQSVLERFEGTAAATQAAMLLAQTHYDAGQWDEGISVLRRAERSAGKEFRASIQSLIGTGLEGKGDNAAAAQAYLAAAAAARFDLERQGYLADAARAHAAAGNTAEATRLWGELAENVQSPFAPEARVRLGELTAQPIQAVSSSTAAQGQG